LYLPLQRSKITETAAVNMAAAIGTLQVQRNTSIRIKTCRTVVLTVGLYGCETWSLTLSEVIRLRGLANRVLREIFVANREEVVRKPKPTQISIDDDDEGRSIRRMEKVKLCGIW
jgi:hypothetical protein